MQAQPCGPSPERQQTERFSGKALLRPSQTRGQPGAPLEVQKPAFAKQRKPATPAGGAETKSPKYGDGPGYWDDRYRKDGSPFEWLKSYQDVKQHISDAIGGDTGARILHVGCGNSALPEELYDDGFTNVVNIDTSSVAIELMRARNAELRPLMEWHLLDATDTGLEAESFDLVIDKSVLDTFACMDRASLVSARYLREVSRLLAPGGTMLCICFGSPSSRLLHFRAKHLELEVRWEPVTTPEDKHNTHYLYVAKKPLVSTGADQYWPLIEKALSY